MIIDIHTHVGEGKHAYATIESLKEEMRKSGTDISVCFIMGKGSVEDSLQLAEDCDDQIIPFIRFDPKQVTPEKLKPLLPKFKGVKFHPRLEDFDPLDPEFDPIYKTIEGSGLPIIIHTRKEETKYSDPEYLLPLPEPLPFGFNGPVVIHVAPDSQGY